MLLTDEEIKKLTELMIMIDPSVIAKAQLKKVVEYLKEHQRVGLEFGDIPDHTHFTMPDELWQSLLEEVKDATE